MGNYETLWTVDTPGYLIFLIDQSGSMGDIFDGKITKAEETAIAISKVIRELVLMNAKGTKIKEKVFITMIGYGEIVDEIRSSYLGEFAISPLRIETAIETKLDINGNIVETKRNTPIYLEPTYDGHTPMGDAFSMAKQLIEAWIDKYPNRPAPIIINISDGAPYSSNGENESEKTISVCNEIMNLNTLDGAPLIFNFHLGSDKNAKVVLPSSKNELKDEMSSFLYEISSTLPHRIKSAAVRYDLIAKDNSKGLISNGNAIDLLKFIQFGSLTNQ